MAPDPAGTWHRVHPVSPFVRGWIALAAIAYFFGRDWFEGFFRGEPVWAVADGRLGWTAAALGVVLVLLVGGYVLSWWFTRYQITGDHVRVNSGILFRQHRQARLDRVQAIDIVQPLLARIFALAELKFEVADAGESAVRLAYLPLADAQRLRAAILAHAAGIRLDPAKPEEAPEAPEQQVLAVPGGRVAGAALLSGTTVFLVLAVAAAAVLAWLADTPAAMAVLLPTLFGTAAGYWGFFSTAYNFRAAISPDGIRLRYGLLETRAQTVPPGRVQAVSVSQPPLWRAKGWYRMRVNVAGYGAGGENAAARTTLLPVGTRQDVMQILALVLPDPGTPDPLAVFGAGLAGSGSGAGFRTSPRRARWLSPLSFRRNGYAATGTALLARSGALWRELAVVPHERTQSIALHQGPLARRLGLADLRLHTTVGPVDPRVRQLDTAAARLLFDEQAARAAAARRIAVPERWLEQRPGSGPATDTGPAIAVNDAQDEKDEQLEQDHGRG
ncbi:PH domain-containing protein [Arthrobacter sp. I2-34]|uniref:PH domain-containing protein n=1 Tax=Arthrobacter hankyongi TaxID=2904801 RepID=A0ABS9LC41_9MICC|nr:PH domain-containing protein [Arthrobacter hankyongi]MCG2624241.1 PH domain-containing protein [Arthrobacter hankyongi]